MDTDSKILGLMGGAVLVCVWIYQNYYVLLAMLVFFYLIFALIVGISGPPLLVWRDAVLRRKKQEQEKYDRERARKADAEAREKRRVERKEQLLEKRYRERVKQEAEEKVEHMKKVLTEPLYSFDGESDVRHDEWRSLWVTHGYKQLKFVPLGKQKPEWFLIKTVHPESPEHTFVVQSIAKLLKGRVQDLKTYAAVAPDIIFTYKDKQYAFEIETPLGLRKKRGRLREKARTNNEEFPHRWWFVVTRSAYKRSFTTLGKVLTRNEVIPFINKRFPPPPLSSMSLHNMEQRHRSAKVCKSRRQKQKRTR